MVQASESLVWMVVRNNNAFLKKRNGKTSRTGAVQFSTEKGNIKSISSFKYSGIANNKTVDIVTEATANYGPKGVLVKGTSKASSQPTKGSASTPLSKNFRKVEKTLMSQTVDNFYRPDLKSATLAKWSAVYRANRIAKGVKKAVPVKKGRN